MNLAEMFAKIDERLTFNAASHRYWLDGKPVPGVTTVLRQLNKPALNDWAVRVQQEADIATAWNMARGGEWAEYVSRDEFARQFRAEAGEEYEHAKQARDAADLGSELHALVEKHLKAQLGVPCENGRAISDAAQEMFSAHWLPWAKDVKLEPIFVERLMFSEEHRYAGALDLGARIEGGPSVLDWKTKEGGKLDRLYIEPVLQNHAYRAMADALTGRAWNGHVVNVARDGSGLVVHQIPWQPDMMDGFLACLKLHRVTADYFKRARA